MPRKTTDIAADIDAILARADSEAANAGVTIDRVPGYMLTAEQWAKRWSVTGGYARTKLRALRDGHGWQVVKYRIACEGRRAYPVIHYGPVV